MGQAKRHVLVLTVLCKIRLYYKTWIETNSNIFNFFVTESLHFRKYTQLKNKESVSICFKERIPKPIYQDNTYGGITSVNKVGR